MAVDRTLAEGETESLLVRASKVALSKPCVMQAMGVIDVIQRRHGLLGPEEVDAIRELARFAVMLALAEERHGIAPGGRLEGLPTEEDYEDVADVLEAIGLERYTLWVDADMEEMEEGGMVDIFRRRRGDT